MTPIFKISLETTDLTNKIGKQLMDLRVTDETGLKSDQMSFKLNNAKGIFAIPKMGGILSLSMGYEETGLVYLGKYVIDEVATTVNPRTLKVTAKATDFTAGLKVRKTRIFTEIKLGELIAKIAKEHELEPRISDVFKDIDIAPIPYRQLDQTNESDLHLLGRIAKHYDAMCTPKNGYLYFVTRGVVIADAKKPVHHLKDDVTSARARASERDKYKSVTAYYNDSATEQRLQVSTGNQEPTFVMRRTFQDAQSAQDAVRARLDAIKRGKATISISMPADPTIGAEHEIIYTSVDELCNGTWIATRVEHTLNSSGFKTQIAAESPKVK